MPPAGDDWTANGADQMESSCNRILSIGQIREHQAQLALIEGDWPAPLKPYSD